MKNWEKVSHKKFNIGVAVLVVCLASVVVGLLMVRYETERIYESIEPIGDSSKANLGYSKGWTRYTTGFSATLTSPIGDMNVIIIVDNTTVYQRYHIYDVNFKYELNPAHHTIFIAISNPSTSTILVTGKITFQNW